MTFTFKAKTIPPSTTIQQNNYQEIMIYQITLTKKILTKAIT